MTLRKAIIATLALASVATTAIARPPYHPHHSYRPPHHRHWHHHR